MTMTSSRHVSARVSAISSLIAIAFVPSTSNAAAYVGAGVGAFDSPGYFDGSSKGAELTAGLELRPWLAIEAGVLEQKGENRYDDVPAEFMEYEWRALYAGPRFSHALGERWQAHAGLALAHVGLEREEYGIFFDDAGDPVGYHEGGRRKNSSWGALARLGLAVDLTPRQRLSLDYRRLYAGLEEVCESYIDEHSNGIRCGLLRHRSMDGVSLTWSWRFD